MQKVNIIIKIYLFLDKHFIGYFRTLTAFLFVACFFERLFPVCYVLGTLAYILSAYGDRHKWYLKYNGGTGSGTEI